MKDRGLLEEDLKFVKCLFYIRVKGKRPILVTLK
jgi:hypothetical protein